MKSNLTAIFISVLAFFAFSGTSSAQSQTHIKVDSPMAPPAWALMECQLLEENARFVEMFADKYIDNSTGFLKCIPHWGGSDGADDAMENFNNWSLLYALGANKNTLDLENFVWNGHIDQYTQAKHPMSGEPMYYREFITSFDFEHNGEGIASFLLLPLSDPNDWRTKERIVRFADFYTGKDTTTHNYDPEHKIIRSILNGSKGPTLEVPNEYWFFSHDEWLKHTKLKDSRFYIRANSPNHMNVKGDGPLNLLATSLAVNAYLSTGDAQYKDWVLEYADAWRQRAVDNGGNIPSHVGLNGIVGEHWDGKWYGGIYGWDNGVINGFNIVCRGMRVGFGNAFFLSGDKKFLDVLRKQGDILLAKGKKTDEGMVFPNRYGDNGWYEYSKNPGNKFGEYFADLYIWTLEDQDLKRLYEASQGAGTPWIEFLKGKNPGFPENALSNEFEDLRAKMSRIKNDKTTADTRLSDETQSYSTAATSALVNLTMGGLQPMTYGGLLYCQLRYFDKKGQRPGLPENVAALVTEITNDMVKVTLVNIDQSEPKEVIIQGGAYGETQFVSVEQNGKITPVNKKCMAVTLAPGAGSVLTLHTKRFANQPTLAFPWE